MAITRDLTFATIYTDQGIELGDTLTYTTLNDGTTSLTATVAELNTLDGITATTAELNYTDGVTSNLQTQLDAKLPLAGGTMTGNIVMSGAQTVDGRDLSADGTKLDGIESGATADQTASEILTALLTVDGTTSGLDADLLDGQHGSYYAPIAGPTFTGTLTYATLNDGTTALTSTVAELNTLDGITATVTELNYTDGVTSNLQTQLDAKAPLASPTLTGTPLAPTAAAATNTTQIATTAFVQTAVSNLVDAAPSTLDTLNELAAALGDDANFSTTVTNSIATKVPLAGGTMTGALNFGDSVKAVFGAGSDLQIYHNGSHSYIADVGTGNLSLTGENLYLQSTTGETYLAAINNGAVTLNYDNSAKLATTSTGIDVTGTVTADGLTVDGGGSFTQAGGGIKVINNGTAGYNANIFFGIYDQTDGWSIGQGITANDGVFRLYDNGAGNVKISVTTGGDVSFYEDTGTTAKFFWDASAEALGIGTTSPTQLLHLEDTGSVNGRVVSSDGSGDAGIKLRSGGSYDVNLLGSSDTFKIHTGGSERMRIDSSGNVAIGRSSASYKLDVEGDINARGGIYAADASYIEARRQSTTAGLLVGLELYTESIRTNTTNGGYSGPRAINAYSFGQTFYNNTNTNGGGFAIGIEAGVQAYPGGPSISNVTISKATGIHASAENSNAVSGNSVTTLIGISSQTGGGNVTDSISFNAEGSTYGSNVTNQYGYYSDITPANATNSWSVYANGTAPSYFGGNVGIGTTSPTQKLEVNPGTAADPIIQITNSNTAAYRPSLRLDNQATGGRSYRMFSTSTSDGVYGGGKFTIYDDDAGAGRLTIASNGYVGIGTTNPTQLMMISGSSNPAFSTNNTSGPSANFYTTTGTGVIGTGSNHAFEIHTNNTEKIRIDTSGNVGIGTTSPSEKLEVYGAVTSSYQSTDWNAGSFRAFMDIVDSSKNVRIGSVSGSSTPTGTQGEVTFHIDGTEHMRLDVDGKLGVGTSDPANKIDIRSGGSYSAAVDMTNAQLRLKHTTFPVQLYAGLDHVSRFAYIQASETGVGYRDIALQPAGGNVGIGKTDPKQLLQVKESSSSTSSVHYPITVGGSNHVSGYAAGIGFDPEGYGYRNKCAIVVEGINQGWSRGKLHFLMAVNAGNDTEATLSDSKMVITEDYVLVNRTGNDGSAKFQVAAPNGGVGIGVATGTTSTTYMLEFRSPSGSVGTISTSGSSTSYNTSSDYRLKENVVELTGATERLKQIPVRRFNFINDPDKTVDGFIAHEISSIVPEAVTGEKDGMQEEEYEISAPVLDSDGTVVTEGVMGTRDVPVYQGIDQAKLVPLLTAALQEAIAEIENLKTRIEAIENA